MLQARLESLGGEERESLERVQRAGGGHHPAPRRAGRRGRGLQKLAGEVHALESAVQRDDQDLAYWRKDLEETSARVAQAEAELDALLARQARWPRPWRPARRSCRASPGRGRRTRWPCRWRRRSCAASTSCQTEISLRLEQERAGLVGRGQRGWPTTRATSSTWPASARTWRPAARSSRGEVEALRAAGAGAGRRAPQVARRVEESRHTGAPSWPSARARRRRRSRARARPSRRTRSRSSRLREELSDKRSRLSSLEELQKNYEGFDRGVRAVMVRAGGGSPRAGHLRPGGGRAHRHAALRARGGGRAGRAAAARHRREPREGPGAGGVPQGARRGPGQLPAGARCDAAARRSWSRTSSRPGVLAHAPAPR